MSGLYKITLSQLLSLIIVLLFIKSFSLAADHAVILQYHHFGDDTPPSTSVTLRQFDDHLLFLKENKYNIWHLEKIVKHIQEGKQLPEKCIAITIDDAYTSVYERAFPRLKELGWPFTVFVATKGIDEGLKSYMTWEQMRNMQDFGASFASHSNSHAYLIRQGSKELEEEWKNRVTKDILISMKRLKEELGSASNLFAYPYGEYNSALKEIVNNLHLIGFGQHSGAVWKGSNFLALPRFPMAAHYADMEQFITKVRSLPLPVIYESPDCPVLLQGIYKPILSLKLFQGDYLKDSLTCYASEQGEIKVNWKDYDNLVFEVVANDLLPNGRSRYNCTALHKKEDRYYWYSHLWIRGNNHKD